MNFAPATTSCDLIADARVALVEARDNYDTFLTAVERVDLNEEALSILDEAADRLTAMGDLHNASRFALAAEEVREGSMCDLFDLNYYLNYLQG